MPARRRRSLPGLAQAVRSFDLQREDFIAVIDGMEMDVVADIRAPDRATLDLYCDRVACAVGRLSVRVFGMERDAGLALAHHLGRALQLTNILRDLDEDAAMGRLYLPREALRDAGIIGDRSGDGAGQSGARRGLRRRRRAGASRISRKRSAIMAQSPRRVVRAPRIMGEAYRAHSRRDWSRAALRRRARRCACRAPSFFSSCCAICSDRR